MAQEDAEKSKILASLTIAQAIIESAWGNSGLTKGANALFGIKAGSSWKGPRVSCKTFEYYDGKRADITDAFRAYSSWDESVADHSRFLCGLSRYKAVVGETDYTKACRAIKAAGYATAPNYAQALIDLIEQYELWRWDGKGTKPTAQKKEQKKSVDELAREVIRGKWGNGEERKWKLTAAGYNYAEVQRKVNAMLKK